MKDNNLNDISAELDKLYGAPGTAQRAKFDEDAWEFYSKEMKDRFNELWNSGELDQQRLDQINKMDLHKL